MSDLRDEIRRAAERREPPADWLGRIQERVRRRRRAQRVLAGTLGLGLSLALVVGLVLARHARGPSPVAVTSPLQCTSAAGVQPTGWWRAEGSGADQVGGLDAVFHGDVGFAPGVEGKAFALDGRSAFVEVPDDPALNVGTGDFTLSFWVRLSSLEGSPVLVEDWVQTPDPATTQGWTVIKLSGGGIGLGLGREAGVLLTHGFHFQTDTWTQVAIRRQGGGLSIFVDGLLASKARMNDPSASLDSSASIKFGYRGGPQDTPGSTDDHGFFLHGELDDVQLFVGRALADPQIRRIYQIRSSCL